MPKSSHGHDRTWLDPIAAPRYPVSLRRLLAALSLVGALLGAGCGSSEDSADPSAPPAAEEGRSGSIASDDGDAGEGPAPETDEPAEADGTVDPCALLAGLDLEGLLATPPGDPEGEDDPLGAFCVVEAADDTSRAQARLVVVTDRAADNYETQKEVFGGDSEVSGLGDAAFHSGPYLFVLDGDTLFFLQVVRDASTGPGVDDADLEVAARQVLQDLGG
jgi:hypothetical protein